MPLADLLDLQHRVTAFVERAGWRFESPGYLAVGTLVWNAHCPLLDWLAHSARLTEPWDATRMHPVPPEMIGFRG